MKKIILIFTFLILINTSTFSEFIGEVDFNVGQTIDLDAYIVKEGNLINRQEVYWSTDDSSIATVDSNGLVTAKKNGRTFITATDNSIDQGKSVVIFVSVRTSIASIELENSKIAMIVGEELSPNYDLVLMNKDIVEYNSKAIFKSMNTNVVNVVSNRLVAVKAGSAKIYVYTEDGNKSDFMDVTVKEKYKEIKIDNLEDYQTLYVGEEFDVIVVDENNNVITSGLSFMSGRRTNLGSDGKLEVIGSSGDVYYQLKVTTKSGKSDYVKLKLENLVKAVEIDKNRAVIENVGEEIILKAQLIRKYEDKEPIWNDVIWSSSNSSIASVSDGVVKGIKTGVVRITATSKDGEFTDSCSIVVNPSEQENYTIESYIKDIKFSVLSESYTIGDKIPLSISYTPIDAEANTLKFKLDKGGTDQIVKEGNQYYLIPKYEGKYNITLETESEIKKSIALYVKNNLKSITMNLELDLEKNRRYIVYYGENNEVNIKYTPIVESLGVSDLDYTVESLENKLSFENKKEDSFEFIAKKLGRESIILKSKYSGKQDKIDIIIRPLIEKVYIEENTTSDIGEKFLPKLSYKIFSNDREYIKPLDDEFKVSIVYSNIPVEYIHNEIMYEKEAISELRKIIEQDHGKRDVIGDEISKRLIRKSHFEQSLQKIVNGYYKFSNATLLTDRSGSKIKVASISNNNIIGLFEGFIDYKVTTNDNGKEAIARLNFVSPINDFVVTMSDDIVSSSEKGLPDEIEIKRETELKERIKKRFGNLNGFDIPSENRIITILEFESKVNLDEILKSSYNRYITREDIYKLLINIISSKTDYKSKKVYSSVFLDDNSGIANEAYNLGLISLNLERRSHQSELIDFEEFKILLSKLERVMEVKLAKDVLDSDRINQIKEYKIEDDELLNSFINKDKVSLEEVISLFSKIIKE